MSSDNLSAEQFVYHHTPTKNRGSIERWGLVPRGRAAARKGDVGSGTGMNWFATEPRPGPHTDIWKARVQDIPHADIFVDVSLDTPQTVVATTARLKKVERHNG